jgi:hypothetical protein
MLFEVAILETPTKEEKEDGKAENLLFGPKGIVANNERSAGVVAVMEGKPGEGNIDQSRMVVFVRPFAQPNKCVSFTVFPWGDLYEGGGFLGDAIPL